MQKYNANTVVQPEETIWVRVQYRCHDDTQANESTFCHLSKHLKSRPLAGTFQILSQLIII